MSELDSSTADSLQKPTEKEKLPVGDGRTASARETLQNHSLDRGDLTTAQINSRMSPPSTQTFGLERRAGINSSQISDRQYAVLDGGTTKPAEKASAGEYSPPKPTGDRFVHKETYTPEKNGKPVQIHTWEHVEPTISQSYDPETGVIKESYSRRFGIRGSGKAEDDYGGVWFDKQSSRTLAGREERKTPDGKTVKEIKFKDHKDTYAYGKLLGLTDHRKLDSSRMWQTESVGKDGQPLIESFQEGTIWEKPLNPFGKPYVKDKPEPPQKMSNEEFNRRWAETSPEYLSRIAKGAAASDRIAKTPSDLVKPRPAFN